MQTQINIFINKLENTQNLNQIIILVDIGFF